MTNRELQDLLKQYPDNMSVCIRGNDHEGFSDTFFSEKAYIGTIEFWDPVERKNKIKNCIIIKQDD